MLGWAGIWGIWLTLWSKFDVRIESDHLYVSCYTLLKKARVDYQGMATIKECSCNYRMEGNESTSKHCWSQGYRKWNLPAPLGRLIRQSRRPSMAWSSLPLSLTSRFSPQHWAWCSSNSAHYPPQGLHIGLHLSWKAPSTSVVSQTPTLPSAFLFIL